MRPGAKKCRNHAPGCALHPHPVDPRAPYPVCTAESATGRTGLALHLHTTYSWPIKTCSPPQPWSRPPACAWWCGHC